VLSFAKLSCDAKQGYIAEGITEDYRSCMINLAMSARGIFRVEPANLNQVRLRSPKWTG
jgi:hypothetical protein